MFIEKRNDEIVAASTFKENLEAIGILNIEEIPDDEPALIAFLERVE
ncbi:MAG: hypothetical protein GY804_00700 [Alphaproteobacteria bacterium]|nr:hypothetical protein [Alphaproteobacteria bacterium]